MMALKLHKAFTALQDAGVTNFLCNEALDVYLGLANESENESDVEDKDKDEDIE